LNRSRAFQRGEMGLKYEGATAGDAEGAGCGGTRDSGTDEEAMTETAAVEEEKQPAMTKQGVGNLRR
jgi:hypothetical protein